MQQSLKDYSPQDLARALEQASPEFSSRKLGHKHDYTERTIDRIIALPEVRQKQQALEQEQDRGLNL